MTDRRSSLRLKKGIAASVYIDNEEYPTTILDVADEGIAFTIDKNSGPAIYDRIVITFCDKYKSVSEAGKVFIGNRWNYSRGCGMHSRFFWFYRRGFACPP
ncbi:MAG: PilZ domain-containing protein [Lachnospiraceae bacterium]|nr:PilZ domain-containing protein [Lachnospiraceae bacterium]